MIEIENLTTVQIEEEFLKKIVKEVLKGEGREGESLLITLVGPGRMRKLNKKYHNRNRVIDVLSFLKAKVPFEKFKIGELQKFERLGQIVICLREIKKKAKRSNSTFERELARALIQGTLSLLGYSPQKPAQKEKMAEKENHYLELWQKNIF